MAVLNPLKIVLVNYPEGQVEELTAENNPEDSRAGMRKIPFSKTIFIEREDFREDPPKKYFRLSPGKEIRLKHAYYVKCTDVKKDDATGETVELHCTYDPDTRGGWSSDGRKVKGTLHWVSASQAVDAEVRLYSHLFTKENPDEAEDFLSTIDSGSLQVLKGVKVESSLRNAVPGERYQFLRQGYFCVDPDTSEGMPVFNRTVTLRDTWAKIEKSQLKG